MLQAKGTASPEALSWEQDCLMKNRVADRVRRSEMGGVGAGGSLGLEGGENTGGF